MQPFSFFFCYSLWGGGGGDFGSGSGSKFNCAARVGSGQTISGTGFSFEPVQTSRRREGCIISRFLTISSSLSRACCGLPSFGGLDTWR